MVYKKHSLSCHSSRQESIFGTFWSYTLNSLLCSVFRTGSGGGVVSVFVLGVRNMGLSNSHARAFMCSLVQLERELLFLLQTIIAVLSPSEHGGC